MSDSSDSDSAPAFEVVTAADHAGWLIITSWVFLIFSVFALVAKLIISRFRSAAPGYYDVVLVAATLLALAETVCITFACKYGLGQYRATVSNASFKLVSKYSYAASMLVAASQASSKVSVAVFVMALSPYAVISNLCRFMIAVVLLWVVSGVAALAVRCHLPKPWISAAGACSDQRALSLYVGTINVITDVALVAIPTYLMFLTQSAARYQVIALFSIRIVVPGFVIASLLSLASLFSSPSPDPTRDVVVPQIWTQIALNLSIITACIPSLKRILDAYRSDAAAISIVPPYEVAVSKNRWPKWPDSSIFSFKGWRGKHAPDESRGETHQGGSDFSSYELQSAWSKVRRRGSDKGSSSTVKHDLERSVSTTCLTMSIIGESTACGSRIATDEQSCNTSLPAEEENVNSSLG